MGEQTELNAGGKTEEKPAVTEAAVKDGAVVLPPAFEKLKPAPAAIVPTEASSAMDKIDLTDTIPARAFGLDAAAIEVIRELKCPGATKVEVAWFLYQCKALGLNPLLPGQISFAAYGGEDDGEKERRRVVMVEIGGMRVLAQRTGRYRQGDPPKFEFDEKTKALLAVHVSLYEKVDGEWLKHERRFSWGEFSAFHSRRGWKKMPTIMFAKASEAAMLRFYFADGCAGVYTPEEVEGPNVEGMMPEKPKKSIAERVKSLLGRAAKAYKRIGVAKPNDMAVSLAKESCPEHSSSTTWGEPEVEEYERRVVELESSEPEAPAAKDEKGVA